MSEPMTLEEALAIYYRASATKAEIDDAYGVLVAHAERTVAARSGEPEWLTTTRMTRFLPRDRKAEALAYIDTLTAELAAARQEFAEWLDASRTALDAHAAVVADRDRLAACVERVRFVAVEESWDPMHAERNGWRVPVVTADSILSALEGTNAGNS